MGEPFIRPFRQSDVDFAHEMTRIEDWNYSKRDIQRMLSLNPHGCFVAEIDSKQVGHVFTVNYGSLGWIGLLIVRAEWRRKGVASLLMKKAIEHLLSKGVETIRLEAAPTIANLYRKFGFEEYDSLRFVRTKQKIKFTKKLEY